MPRARLSFRPDSAQPQALTSTYPALLDGEGAATNVWQHVWPEARHVHAEPAAQAHEVSADWTAARGLAQAMADAAGAGDARVEIGPVVRDAERG
jgi:hypothetical protein